MGLWLYDALVTGNCRPKKRATPQDVVRLAKKVNWHDIKLPSGDEVTAEIIRQIFKDTERILKPSRIRKRAHATAA